MLRAVVVGVGLVAFTATAAATIGGRRIAARIEKFLGAPAPEPARAVAEAVRRPTESAPEVAARARLPPNRRSTPRRRIFAGAPPCARCAATFAGRSAGGGDVTGARPGLGGAGGASPRSRPESRRGAAQPRLETNPHGVLRQEALVLAIEAADARGDRRGAEGFARAYQREFPSGRFKQLAQRYLDEKNARVRALPSKP